MLRGNVYSSFILKQFKTIQSSSKQTESRVVETFLTLDLFQSQIELTKMGDYPGSGYKMSSYGLKTYNPQETVGQWTQCCKVGTHLRLLCIIEATVVRSNCSQTSQFRSWLFGLLKTSVLGDGLSRPSTCSRSIFCPAVGFGKDYMFNLTDYSRKDFVVAYENREPQGV